MTQSSSELVSLAFPYGLDAMTESERVDVEGRLSYADTMVADAFYDEVRAVRETMAALSATSISAPIRSVLSRYPNTRVVLAEARAIARREIAEAGRIGRGVPGTVQPAVIEDARIVPQSGADQLQPLQVHAAGSESFRRRDHRVLDIDAGNVPGTMLLDQLDVDSSGAAAAKASASAPRRPRGS